MVKNIKFMLYFTTIFKKFNLQIQRKNLLNIWENSVKTVLELGLMDEWNVQKEVKQNND